MPSDSAARSAVYDRIAVGVELANHPQLCHSTATYFSAHILQATSTVVSSLRAQRARCRGESSSVRSCSCCFQDSSFVVRFAISREIQMFIKV